MYIHDFLEKKEAFHYEQGRNIQIEFNSLDEKLNRLTDLLIDGEIEKDIYNRKVVEITTRRHNITVELSQKSKSDVAF